MIKLLKKYNALREQYWTHILLPFPYIFLFFIWLAYDIYKAYGKSSDLVPVVIYLFGAGIYLCGVVLAITVAIICAHWKKKVTNKFFLHNIFYGLIWHVGNILSTLLIIINITFFIILNIPI